MIAGAILRMALSFGDELVADLAGAEQHALGGAVARIGNHGLKASAGEIGERRRSRRIPQHALRREDDQRLPPLAQRLSPQQMKILRGGRRLANLHVVARRELQESLDSCAGVFRALAFVAVRQQQHDAGQQIPLVLARRDELVDDDLRAVREIAELRFPQHQRLGIVAAESVFEAQHGRLGKRRIVDFAQSRNPAPGAASGTYSSSVSISISAAVPLIESPAPAVLSREPHRDALLQQRAERQCLGHSEIDCAFAAAPFPAAARAASSLSRGRGIRRG